jgi:transposase
MARILSDELWAVIAPHLPPRKRRAKRKGGRPPVENRAALTGILFVLRHGLPWGELPRELGCGSGVTCWRRLVAWQQAGVWPRVWRALLEALQREERLQWERVALDGSAVAAPKGGARRVAIPPTEGKSAPSTISWSINKESRLQLRSRRRTRMIPR